MVHPVRFNVGSIATAERLPEHRLLLPLHGAIKACVLKAAYRCNAVLRVFLAYTERPIMTLMLYLAYRNSRATAVFVAAFFFIALMLVGAWAVEKPCCIKAMPMKCFCIIGLCDLLCRVHVAGSVFRLVFIVVCLCSCGR